MGSFEEEKKYWESAKNRKTTTPQLQKERKKNEGKGFVINALSNAQDFTSWPKEKIVAEVQRRTNLVSSNDTWPDSSSTMILQWSPDTSLLPGKDKSQP